MTKLFLVAAIATVFGAAGAAAAELLAFELMGLPVTLQQPAMMGATNVREQSPTSSLKLGSMPASPHETPWPTTAAAATAEKPATVGLSAPWSGACGC